MNYKQRFSEKVTALIAENIKDKQVIISRITPLLEDYFQKHGQYPDKSEITRLNDYIFNEEFTNQSRSKVYEEYPILSEMQMSRRHDREYSLTLADTFGADGRPHAVPLRRHRRAKEQRFIDRESHRKNRVRNERYRRDTTNGKVVTYNLRDTGGEFTEEYTTARKMPELWRNKLSDRTTEIVS